MRRARRAIVRKKAVLENNMVVVGWWLWDRDEALRRADVILVVDGEM